MTNNHHSAIQREKEALQMILQHENSAAGILYHLKLHFGTQAAYLPFTKDVVGVVAMLGRVNDNNLSRFLSEYLGAETMLAIVCKTFDGARALEAYDKGYQINKNSGLSGITASMGRPLNGRYVVISLENLRPYCGGFVDDDPQRRLDILKPRLPNGECLPGFIGFAVNFINVEPNDLMYVTSNGYGLRETLFYSLFSRLQVYKTKEAMFLALPCINEGAISLDGGIVKGNGSIFYQGNRQNVNLRFPKPSATSNLPDNYLETKMRLKETLLKKETMQDDIKREQSVLEAAKRIYVKKRDDFVNLLSATPILWDSDAGSDGPNHPW